MEFEIVRLHQADGEDERLVLIASEDGDIGEYIVLDSTYDEKGGGVSNHFRHVFWFPNQLVKEGEKVILYTKKSPTSKDYKFMPSNTERVGTHIFYWGVDSNVWNDDADSVTLLHITEIDFKRFKDIHVKLKK